VKLVKGATRYITIHPEAIAENEARQRASRDHRQVPAFTVWTPIKGGGPAGYVHCYDFRPARLSVKFFKDRPPFLPSVRPLYPTHDLTSCRMVFETTDELELQIEQTDPEY
jgi:hypothetical protein